MYISIGIALYLLLKNEIKYCKKIGMAFPYIASILMAGIRTMGLQETYMEQLLPVFLFLICSR